MTHGNLNSSVKGVESLESFANNSEQFFRNMGLIDGKNATNSEKNLSALIHHDFNRSMVLDSVNIIENEDWNYYSMYNSVSEIIPVVQYKNPIKVNKNFSVSLYYRRSTSMMSDINDIDDTIFTIDSNISLGIASDIPYLTYYEQTYYFDSLSDIPADEWTILLINFNIQEKKVDLIAYNYLTKSRKSQKHPLPDIVCKEDGEFSITSYNSDLGRIRVWGNVIPVEYENRILFSAVVEKPSSTYIIDDCNVILNSRTHARPDNMERWKDFDEHRRKIN